MDDSQSLMLSERSQTQTVDSLLFYLCEAKEQAKLMECDWGITSSCIIGGRIDWEEEIVSQRCLKYVFCSGCIYGYLKCKMLIVLSTSD